MSDDDWVKTAMANDAVVVELLVRLQQAAPPSKRESSPSASQLEWSVRQRRSKPMIVHSNKKPPPPRSSPTTPLSWSGATATSLSGGGTADGFEESSLPPPKRLDASRSKATAPGGTTTSKRSRKKKTLAELKEEEMLLMKERRHLKKELAALRNNLEKQRATNESLKRLKIDVQASGIGSDQTPQMVATCEPVPSILPPDPRIDHVAVAQPTPPNGSCKQKHEGHNQENDFLLPDLNLPFEEDSKLEVKSIANS